MEVLIIGGYYRKELVDGLRVGFDVQMTIDLPFVPFLGLEIEFPSASDDDPVTMTIRRVVWTQEQKAFVCWAQNEEFEFPTFVDMAANADSFEKDGFTVDRSNMLTPERWGKSGNGHKRATA